MFLINSVIFRNTINQYCGVFLQRVSYTQKHKTGCFD